MDEYFFDSYAVIEVVLGNENYLGYLDCGIVLCMENLFEIYYAILRLYDEREVLRVVNEYKDYVVDCDVEDVVEAANMRFQYKKRDLSMTDCLGYVLAKKFGMKFLTGDKEFADLENVEFVK